MTVQSELNHKTLSLFNSVVAKDSSTPFLYIYEDGVIVNSNAIWALTDIRSHINSLRLSGSALNKTFHKSWKKIQESSREELFVEQINHYLSTYGSNFEDEIYIPNEALTVPDMDFSTENLSLKVISAQEPSFFINKALDILSSGLALKEETLGDLFFILDTLNYTFDGTESIKNKEAMVLICHKYGIYPSQPEEFLRYLVWTFTESTLLIKSNEVCHQISNSNKDVSSFISKYGVENLAPIFNRFKSLFLAMRKSSPENKNVINKISKLSKTLHKPMVQNPLNLATQNLLIEDNIHWLENATPYALLKALEACYNRKEGQTSFIYRIRNGKSWVKEQTVNMEVCEKNYEFIISFLKNKFNGNGKIVFIPNFIQFGVPTSEKMMVGNVPTGTKFFGESLAAGVYWEDNWGANDIDISGVNFDSKIGWDGDYNNSDNSVSYSGDVTSAPNGAVEYLWAKGDFKPTLVMSNIFSGDEKSGYKIIIGQGDDVSRDYMMNPNNVLAEVKTCSVQNQTVVGLLINEGNNVGSFTLLNFGSGSTPVAGSGYMAGVTTKALSQVLYNGFHFNFLLEELNYKVVDSFEDNAINLSIPNLTKISFMEFFN